MKWYTQEVVDLIVQQAKNSSYIEWCKATEAIYRDMFAKAKEEQWD